MESAAVWVSIDELRPWDKNPRKNEKAIPKVVESMKRFGFAAPIIARLDGEIIAGHTRYQAAKQLGLDRVPVRYMDLDPADARLLALADNKLNEIAEWDENALNEILRELNDEQLLVAGFDIPKEIDVTALEISAPEEQFCLFIDCPDEETLRDLFDEMSSRSNLKVKLV
jgi:ParB/RepB/Spo0J family partition protein